MSRLDPKGLMAAATYIHSNTAGALEAAGRDFPGWPLVVTGHSMGGTHRSPAAVCAVHCLLLKLCMLTSFAFNCCAISEEV